MVIDSQLWIIAAVAILIVLIGVAALFVFLFRRKEYKPNYYALFLMGIIWVPVGIAISNYVLSVVGLVFLIVGLTKRKEWNKHQKEWNKLNKREKRFRILIMVALGILVLLGIILYYLVNFGVIA